MTILLTLAFTNKLCRMLKKFRNPCTGWMLSVFEFMLYSPAQQPPYTITWKHQSLFHITAGVKISRITHATLHSSFLHPTHYSIPQFLNVMIFHYNIFTKAVHNQTSNWLLVNAHIAIVSHFLTKHLKYD